MLRFSLRISEDLIRCARSLKVVRYYMSILEVRFGAGLDLRLDEEEAPYDLEIVKFLLQPLIENAVKYSFIHQAKAKVRITVRADKDQLVLSVADNGIGMDPEALRGEGSGDAPAAGAVIAEHDPSDWTAQCTGQMPAVLRRALHPKHRIKQGGGHLHHAGPAPSEEE